MRVVLDTNVLISAIFFGGIPGKVVDAWIRGAYHLVVSPAVLSEYRRVADELVARSGVTGVEHVLDLLTLHAEVSAIPTLTREFAAARSRGATSGFAIESPENKARNAAFLVETSDPSEFFDQLRAFANAAPVLSLFLSGEPVMIRGLEARPAGDWNSDCSTKIELTPDRRAALRIRMCEPGKHDPKHEFWIVTGDHRVPGRSEPEL